jgi:hypothetical protein
MQFMMIITTHLIMIPAPPPLVRQDMGRIGVVNGLLGAPGTRRSLGKQSPRSWSALTTPVALGWSRPAGSRK